MGIVENIASNIKHFRLRAGISQEELAGRCDLHRTYIGSVERGERNISARNIERIASALDVRVEQLIEEKDE